MKPTSEELAKDVFNKKKFSKPLMERRRRARINESLTELKTLVLSSLNKDHSKFNKMEKADVLELTVNYLKTLTMGAGEQPVVNEMDQQRHFIAGYNECAREVQLYLLRSTEVSPQAKAQMLSHISATPQEITPGPTMVSQTKPNEISFTATKPSFSPIMSAYPSPPASPVYMQTSTETMSKELRNALYLENRASNSQDTYDQKKQISVSNPNQRLWRPWQSA